jgi:type IV secretory pathway TraG/TraD family ATPase VirD4
LALCFCPKKSRGATFFVAGTSGTGKSVCLNHYIQSLNQLKASTSQVSKSVIYDVKGEFTGKHYRAEDVIFYPFDQRSAGWSFFNEVLDYPDLDVLCTSLYEPPKDSKDAYWYNAARDVFRTGLFYLLREKKTTNRDIWEFFSQPLHQIRDCMYSLPIRELGALKHIDKADSNQAASVISILQERLTFFRYVTDSDGSFSFRKFIRDDVDRLNLFLMNIRQYDAIFRPLMTFAIDVMIREVLSLPDSYTRRITFLIDEFGSLSKMTSIFDFLTMARSKGGFLVVANQDLGSVSNVYGKDQKEAFFNNFNLHLIFRINDPITAEFLSKAFGEREVIKKFSSSQMSPTDLGDRFSISDQEKLEKIILPTEFQNLKDFETFLKIANYGITRMETPRRFLPSVTPEFLPRDFGLEEMLKEKSEPRAPMPPTEMPQFAP